MKILNKIRLITDTYNMRNIIVFLCLLLHTVSASAEFDYKKVLAIKPEYAKAYNNLAFIFFAQKKFPLAWAYLKNAERLGFEVHPDFKNELIRSLKEIKKNK